MLPKHLKKFAKPTKILDQGEVSLVDVFGDEQAIIDAARVSYGVGTKRATEDAALLRYLMRHHHTSPFEMCEIKLRIHIPMDAWRQMVRHRTASLNEVSSRYSVVEDANQITDPDEWRLQAKDNKQGSSGSLTGWPEGFVTRMDDGSSQGQDADYPLGAWIGQDYHPSPGSYLSEKEADFHQAARELYDERLKFGVAREQARKDLPLSTYTTLIWKCDLHNLLHFLRLRLDPHAQLEIRLYAQAIANIVKAWVPTVWEAFNDYTLGAQTFSRMEVAGLRHMYNQSCADLDSIVAASGLKGREALEFRGKLAKINMVVD